MYLIQMFVHILSLTSTNVINRNVDLQDKQTHLFQKQFTELLSHLFVLYYITLYYKLFMFSFDFY